MNCIRKIKQTCKDRVTSQFKSHTYLALSRTSYIVLGCSAWMAISIRSLSCCIKYEPQYFLLFSPAHIWAFVLIIRHEYKELEEVHLDWEREEAQEIRSQKLRDASKKSESEADKLSDGSGSSNGGKSKRRNHRGGVKAKKIRGRSEEASATYS
ncbi:9d5e7f9d-ba6c-4a9c-b27a-359298954e7f-CDS [Sclerotinia trifoliorum]|uniref:9d5e7f9d-ba6c-4a9c-b27a-359298954e7f-CDS n=1 Tax=Sclerotinia trifoliorum TaxID=28548 RepID=A0A8H2VPD8_9HELO|nr:9d5e7f9d-ba6c-4a9c-b27a-359298954e7f-CDS [Sclerotinia trifoliorum]